MLNPQFVAGEHGLFGGHKSEDFRTFFYLNLLFFAVFWVLKVEKYVYRVFRKFMEVYFNLIRLLMSGLAQPKPEKNGFDPRVFIYLFVVLPDSLE